MAKEQASPLLQYYIQNITTFCDHFENINDRLSANDILKLRVSIKKLRAIIDLAEEITNGEINKTNHQEIFKDIFNSSGIVRNIHVNFSLICQYKISSAVAEYKKHILHKEVEATYNINKTLYNFDLDMFNENTLKCTAILEKISKEDSFKHAINFINKKLKHINNLNENLSIEHIHNIRKHLKATKTILHFLSKTPIYKKLKEIHENISIADNLIGDWQNRIIFNKSIEDFLTIHSGLSDIQQLKDIIEKNKIQCNQLVLQVNNVINKTLPQEAKLQV